MFKIKGKTIHITRGDGGTISIRVPQGEDFYEFKENDKIVFIVKPKNGFDSEEYSLRKELILEEDTKNPMISLTKIDTLIGEPINKPVTYWYELSLNDDQSFICYDEDGAKEFILYPDGYDGSEI